MRIQIQDILPNSESSREKTKEGFLLVKNCRVARAGIIQYQPQEVGAIVPKDFTGSRVKIFRDADFTSPEVLKTLELKPVTVTHPKDINAKNARRHVVGSMGNIRAQDQFILADLMIYDEDAIRLIERDEMKELSLGYTADVEWQNGVSPSGESYDAVSKNYEVDHVALVKKGRAGAMCRVNDEDPEPNKEKTMKLKLGDKEIEVPDEAGAVITKAFHDEANTITALTKERDTLKGQADEAKAQLTAVQAKLTDEAIHALVSERASVIERARVHLGDEDLSKLPVSEIKRKTVEAVHKIELKDASPLYIDGRFDALADVKTAPTVFRDHAQDAAKGSTPAEDDRPLSERRRAARIKENQDKLKG